ncbi:AraC family transcriptional regulator [Kineococcus sp. NPDC059986]|uniref:AraC family transcriptional regulator n=1 Tax=Kineococcus sp. NPDC059986 TaxID=3155538 RepID=UPI00344B5FD7
MSELGLDGTNGILCRPGVQTVHSSAGLGLEQLYLSTQLESPYGATFAPAATSTVILHLDGPVRVSRGPAGRRRSRQVAAGGLFLHPAGRELTVELGSALRTVHLYLTAQALDEAAGGRSPELAEDLGVADALLEQLVRALDRALRDWEPAARTYVDQLTSATAAQLTRFHARGRGPATDEPGRGALSEQQHRVVHALMQDRLGEPLPLAVLAQAVGLGPSQFSRRFKARTGVAPHQYLLDLRVDEAARLLRSGTDPIALVAARCGFSHQEHLTRVFRARLGTTPGTVRRGG